MGTGSSKSSGTRPAPTSSDPSPSGACMGTRRPESSEPFSLELLDAWLADYLARLPPLEPMDEEDDEEEGERAPVPESNAAPTDEQPPAPEGGSPNETPGETPAAAAEGGSPDETPGETPAAATDGGSPDEKPGETPAAAAPSESAQPGPPRMPNLKVTGVKFFESTNAMEHHTVEYEQDVSNRDVIVRRGQPVKLDIDLSRQFRPEKERLFLEFAAKSTVPRLMASTLVRLDVNGKNEDTEWSATVEKSENNCVSAIVKSPSDAIIGSYTLTVKVQSQKTMIERAFPQDKKILVLFNAWCEDDLVFIKDEEERKEYVLEDNGLIWRSSLYSPKLWNFGQFDLDVRRVVFDILESNISAIDRRDPIKVCRKLSYCINKLVLRGRWDSKYDDGVHPSHWNGSVKILEKYAQEKSMVKYGQCWVFSGLFTTFLRCIGIPSRSVTNYDSAHDTDNTMTIDRYKTDDGDPPPAHDSIWNFHVWNEAWMARPDLDEGYGGWQVIDSTPQEYSEGKFQCGPAPVIAIKRGMVNQGYDSRFIFAEVNADCVTWKVSHGLYDLKYTMIGLEKDAVGHNIRTKKVGVKEANDITLEYKYKEGSDEERAAVKNAVSKGMIRRNIYGKEGEKDDVVFVINHADVIHLGQEFEVEVETSNTSDDPRGVFWKIRIDSCYYTGIMKENIRKEKQEIVVQSKESVGTSIKVSPDEYVDKMDDEGLITVFVIGDVKETGKTICKQKVIKLTTPTLEVNSEVTGSEIKLKIEFTNPLDRKLTNCMFNVEAPMLVKPFSTEHGDIPPKEKVTREITLTARGAGRKTVIVDFECKQLRGIEGDVMVEVKKTDEE